MFTWTTNHGDTVEVYESGNGEFRYRIQARNGEVVESGEGYKSWHNAIKGAERHHPRVEDES